MHLFGPLLPRISPEVPELNDSVHMNPNIFVILRAVLVRVLIYFIVVPPDIPAIASVDYITYKM